MIIWGVNGLLRFDFASQVNGVIDYENVFLKGLLNLISSYWADKDKGIIDEKFLSVSFKNVPDSMEVDLMRKCLEEVLKSKE